MSKTHSHESQHHHQIVYHPKSHLARETPLNRDCIYVIDSQQSNVRGQLTLADELLSQNIYSLPFNSCSRWFFAFHRQTHKPNSSNCRSGFFGGSDAEVESRRSLSAARGRTIYIYTAIVIRAILH